MKGARLGVARSMPGVVAAFAALGRRWLAAVCVALVWWQSPLVMGDLTRAGSAEMSTYAVTMPPTMM